MRDPAQPREDLSTTKDRATGGQRIRRASTTVRVQIITLVGVFITAIVVALANGVVGRIFPTDAGSDQTPLGGGVTVGVALEPKCGQSYALPNVLDPDTQGGRLNSDPLDQLLVDYGGAPLGDIILELVLTGTSDSPTRVLDLSVVLKTTVPNLSGTAVLTSCQGDEPTISTSLDLDQPPRALMSGAQNFFDGHDLDVSTNDRETIRIFATASERSYRWVFALRYVDASGAIITSYLGSDGQLHDSADAVPVAAEFALSGAADSYEVRYAESGGRFYLCGAVQC